MTARPELPRHPANYAAAPMSCDTTVVLGDRAAEGVVCLAKNSDRPARESQRLVMVPRRAYPEGATVRCQYLELPQVRETYRLIGSQPSWLWGFEHGMNEHHVAIGNEAIYTREPAQEIGLLGMDLVRLGLERGRTADDALRVITTALERYGQGGMAMQDDGTTYDNSFIIADPDGAWVLETSGRRWVARRVVGAASISNQPSIEEDWDAASDDLVDHAIAQGWWPENRRDRFNFAKAYGDYANHPTTTSQCRFARARQLVGDRPRLEPRDLMQVLRDHYEGALLAPRWSPAEPDYPSICMHPTGQFNGGTAASMVAVLRPQGSLATYWGSFGAPCTGVFLPYYIAATLPPALGIAEEEPTEDSPWWQFKHLQEAIAVDYNPLAPMARDVWEALETRLLAAATLIEQRAAALMADDRAEEAVALLDEFMNDNVSTMLETVRRVRSDVARAAEDPAIVVH